MNVKGERLYGPQITEEGAGSSIPGVKGARTLKGGWLLQAVGLRLRCALLPTRAPQG